LKIMTERMNDQAHWARFADEWIAWARSPGGDAFWKYRRALARFIGSGAGSVLEVGRGEDRISRELKTLGYRVTSTDAVVALVEASASIREPVPDETSEDRLKQWARVPLFLWLKAGRDGSKSLSVPNGTKLRQNLGWLLPRRGYRIQPRVSTLGTIQTSASP
jgi:hypothetical protein